MCFECLQRVSNSSIKVTSSDESLAFTLVVSCFFSNFYGLPHDIFVEFTFTEKLPPTSIEEYVFTSKGVNLYSTEVNQIALGVNLLPWKLVEDSIEGFYTSKGVD